MRRRPVVVAAVWGWWPGSWLAGCASMTGPAAVSSLTGTWDPLSAELGGQPFPVAAFRGARLELSDGIYRFGIDQGRYRLQPGAPSQIDVQGESGPNAGRTIAGIFEVQGDSLIIVYQLGSGARPAAFASPAGSRVLLVRYRRVA